MRNNSIYWKTSSSDNAVEIIQALNDKYLIVQLVERRSKKVRVLHQFDSGMSYPNNVAIFEIESWINRHEPKNLYQFYIIRSV